MVRIVLGVIVGFVAWSIIWVGGNEVLARWSSAWHDFYRDFEKASVNNEPVALSSTIIVINLLRSVITSFLSGYLAAFVANENRRTTLILGALLLVVGIGVEASVWSLLPVWYHVIFLLLLVPATIAGGKIKQTT